MADTFDPQRCPTCGTPFDPAGQREDGCPACLLNLALSAEPDESPAGAQELAEGTFVGPYRIVRVLGEGGMGVVYLAEQSEPIRRQVALKVIKHGMDTRSVVARFEAERQALALMDHPAVARVFEAGATESGRPYFVMEYIDGEPITAFCDRHRLGTVERLELFVLVCAGLQHAHQRGIIHRDIKPSNVLVGDRDGKPAPKIIDFGVAKAIEQRLTERTQETALGMLLGTPEYMSPEQADLAPLDVDTRTDVYSLGVVLYEMLTGALPFDIRGLRQAAFDEVRRRIREDRPSRPSTRVSELGDRAVESARSRGSEVSTLSRRLAGDLDLITMKALEKERERRYESPAALAADLRRHLASEPILARSPSALYLLRKLVSKHRLTAVLIAVILVTLVASSIWLALLYRRSQANLARAVDAEAAAVREAAVARQVSEFLVGVFAISDPGEARGNEATARELLDRAAERIDSELDEQPAVRATMMHTMGKVYGSLGLYPRSEELIREALDQRREHVGTESPQAAESLNALAKILADQGRFDDAEVQAREAIGLRERAFGAESLEAAESLELLQLIHWHRREHDEALELAERVLRIREATLGPDADPVGQSLNNISSLYLALGRYDEVEPLLLRARSIRESHLGGDHPGVLSVWNNLAELYRRQARYEEAETLFLQIQEKNAKVLGPDHPGAAFAYNNLGLVYRRMKRSAEAVAQYREALRIREAALPADHPLIAWTLDNMGLALRQQGELAAADRVTSRALEIARKSVGEEHPNTLIVMANLALLRADQGRLADAESTFRHVLELNRKALPAEHPEIAFTLHNLAQVVADQGRRAEAIELFREALAISEAALGADHPDTLDTRKTLDELLAEDD